MEMKGNRRIYRRIIRGNDTTLKSYIRKKPKDYDKME